MSVISSRGRLRVVFATAVVLTVSGCAVHTAHEGPGEEIPGVVPAPKGLKFSVRVAPLAFALGDRVSLEASLFNDSEDEYKKKFHSHCIWDYDLTTMDGVSLRAARECIPQDTTLVLAPGELGVIVRQWSGRERYFNASPPLTPGRYQVVAGFLDADHRVIPMSAPVEIQVLERSGGRK